MLKRHYLEQAHRAALSAKVEIAAHDTAKALGLHIMASQAKARAWGYVDTMRVATANANGCKA